MGAPPLPLFEPLEVGHLPQGGAKGLLELGVSHQRAHRVLTLGDFVDGAEGRAHPPAEQPLPKGRRRLVEHLEERAVGAVVRRVCEQLEVVDRLRVEDERARLRDGGG